MKIVLGVFADDIVDQDSEQFDIIGARYSVSSEDFTLVRTLQLIIVVRLEPGDLQRRSELGLIVPNTTGRGDISGPLPLWDMDIRSDTPSVILKNQIEIAFAKPGFYDFKITLDGQTVLTVPMEAKRI